MAPEAFALDSFSVDHIQPVTDAGTDAFDNLALACLNCNNRKQDDTQIMDAESKQPVALFHPRRDRWCDHFAWSDDLLSVYPLTPIGRVTINRLQLNRPGVVNIRRALLALNEEHPPANSLQPKLPSTPHTRK